MRLRVALCAAALAFGVAAPARAQEPAPDAATLAALAIFAQDEAKGREALLKAGEQGSADAWAALANRTVQSDEPSRRRWYGYWLRHVDTLTQDRKFQMSRFLVYALGGEPSVVDLKTIADRARARGLEAAADSAAYEAVDDCAASMDAEDPAPPAEEGDAPPPSCEETRARGQMSDFGRCTLSQLKRAPAKREIDQIDLIEIYANGWGVPADRKRALKIACRAGMAEAEWISVVQALSAKNRRSAFDWCDHATSGFGAGRCSKRAALAAQVARADAYQQLASGWKEKQRAALAALRTAAEAFFASRASGEQDMSGTMRGAIAINALSRQQDELLADIRAFERGLLPQADDLTAQDKALNAAYAAALKAFPPSASPGPVEADGVRAAQRLWIAYRDAYAAFGVARHPSVPERTWKAWLTRRRADQLRRLIDQDETEP
jgi:uncharacterized protein YecT (DUF1311 family)